MSSPYKPPSAPVASGSARASSPAEKFVRGIVLVTIASLAFGFGCIATVLVLIRALAPSGTCQSPCDGPAYVALGLSILVGPIVGIVSTVLAVRAVVRVWPTRTSVAA
jgi:hypothetical protein